MGLDLFQPCQDLGFGFFLPSLFSECIKGQQIAFRKYDSCGIKCQRAVCLLSMYSIFICWEEFTHRVHVIQQKSCQLLHRNLNKLRLTFYLSNWTFTSPFKIPFSTFNTGCVLSDRWFWIMTCSCHSSLGGSVRILGVLPPFLLCWVPLSYGNSALPFSSKLLYLVKGYGKCEISPILVFLLL